MTKIKPRAAQRYMEECASFCPHCGAVDGIRRVPSEGRFVGFSDERPRFLVPCYCAGCAKDWIEGYALISVELKHLGGGS